MHDAIGRHERLSLVNGSVGGSQADKLRTVSRGMPGVREKKKRKDIRIENRMPTHRTNIKIIEYSGPTLNYRPIVLTFIKTNVCKVCATASLN